MKFGQNHGLMSMDSHDTNVLSLDCLRSLYDHPEAGAHWEQKLEQELLDMGAVRVPEYPSTYTFPSYGHLALVVYVDDFLLSGDSEFS